MSANAADPAAQREQAAPAPREQIPASAPAPASIFAVELLAELIRRGVQDVVVCPGSRSQALALAAAAAERAEAIRLHVRVDERSAGFFALGVARETGLPAPVIVTSGTAVANLAPAVFEAHESRVPLLLLTADRPPELRGIRSNQTTRQAGAFDAVARLSLDAQPPGGAQAGGSPEAQASPDSQGGAEPDPGALAAIALAAALGRPGRAPAGPAHLNLAFREPLSGTRGFDAMIERGFRAAAEEGEQARQRLASERAAGQYPGAEAAGPLIDSGTGSRTDRAADGSEANAGIRGDGDVYVHSGDALAVVIAGEGAGPEAEAFAHEAGLPLLAEVVSGSRFGRETITAYATLLEAEQPGGLVERAIVFGHPTLTRQIPALLRRDDVEVVVVDPHTGCDHYDPSRSARIVRAARVASDHDPRALRRWLGAWVVPDRELQRERSTVHEPDLEAALATGYKERSAYARAEVAAMREPISRELLVESVWRATWPHDRLVLAASRLVRVLDGLAPARRVRVHSNRGLAGIDGTVATAFGIAAVSQGDPDPAKSAGTTRLIIGDIALLHDAGSLLLPDTPVAAAGAEGAADAERAEPHPRLQVFVGNDAGGTIFDGLEVAGAADRADYARVMLTPQRVDIERLALAYGWEYRRVENRGEIENLLTEPVTGPMLVEVPLAR